ncbi:hypothetical protein ILUMI_20580 [Ignelater luminosus]|uniref:PiggyBac transposable element-derived protein domain-containing protein n=1 Tax=Ignelater luminosus TaxID=2038154 RepID=A0A8K0CI72_IGNLU|nr:hypothetical protein ILUMI_20580 [Ignelater luminosus]
MDENREFQINYLRQSAKIDNSFYFPLKPDMAMVSILDIELRRITFPEQNIFSATTQLVLHPTESLPGHCDHNLDNFFNSIELLKQLLDNRIFAAGTIRTNHLANCIFKTEQELKEIDREASECKVTKNKEIVAERWFYNKVVNMASNFVAIEPVDKVRKWDKEQRSHISTKRPAIIWLYKRSMGGVDKCDFLVALYRRFIRSKK